MPVVLLGLEISNGIGYCSGTGMLYQWMG